MGKAIPYGVDDLVTRSGEIPARSRRGRRAHPAVDDRLIPDRSFERFAVTFNPGGYLRRVR
jgi:hypothetical protein